MGAVVNCSRSIANVSTVVNGRNFKLYVRTSIRYLYNTHTTYRSTVLLLLSI
jgi:hypothetical protein